LRVDPNDAEASGLPPAKITVNSQEVRQPVEYRVVSDTMAIVDVSKAFSLAKRAESAEMKFSSAVTVMNSIAQMVPGALKNLQDVNVILTGNYCPGGANGLPIWGGRGTQAAAQSTAVMNQLSAAKAQIEAVLKN